MLGIGLASGEPVSVALLVAIFMSNLPEAIGASSEMLGARRRRGWLVRLWLGVAAICTLATVAGYAVADALSAEWQAGINGFAAGALLVMLCDSMIPASRAEGGAAGRARARARLRGRRRAVDRLMRDTRPGDGTRTAHRR